MSVQAALRFIERVRTDPTVAERLRLLGTSADLEHLVEIGSEAGCDFTGEELRAAFRHDWTLRLAYFGARKGRSSGQESPIAPARRDR